MYLAFDIGGTFIKYGILDDNGNIIEKSKIPTINDREILLDSLKKIYLKSKKHKLKGIAIEPPLSSRQVKKLKTCTHACHVVAGIFLCIMCRLIFLYRLVLRYWILNWILIAQCFTSYFIRCSHTKSSLISFMTVISYPFSYCLF